ncbi:alpha/beta hydrolase [Thiomicrorhabdus arctica]|uniref:alpha/beta hydrolase n=1 Tax=Thiomicrorhabdus arctica TaxID=131540 RepID=UPI00037912BF|nr:alpha/beta fold hydrolase [Thiomicrorhabdus arctica]
MNTKSVTELIPSQNGLIEVRYKALSSESEVTDKVMKLVVLSHPHPLYGGTMNNKIITTMERAFQSLGYVTVAYNFRGVGKSEGEHDQGIGEQNDLVEVIEWAKQRFKSTHLTLAGFSFGSYVALKAYQEFNKTLSVDALCTVAPPVGLYDFSGIHPVKVPWVLIQGGKDEVVSSTEILRWAMAGELQPDIYWRAKAGHFLHGELIWLKNIILLVY